jgi:hypothetical protein
VLPRFVGYESDLTFAPERSTNKQRNSARKRLTKLKQESESAACNFVDYTWFKAKSIDLYTNLCLRDSVSSSMSFLPSSNGHGLVEDYNVDFDIDDFHCRSNKNDSCAVK